MINFTEKASEKIKAIMLSESKENSYLRLEVKAGGCSGLTKEFFFTEEKSDKDYEILKNDIKVIIDKKSLLYLQDTIIDYEDGLNGKGFIWNIPSATRTCSCGDSFCA